LRLAATKLDIFRRALKSKQPAPPSFHQPVWMTKLIPRRYPVPSQSRISSKRTSFTLVLILALLPWPIRAGDQNQTFKIPPLKIPLNIKDQHVAIVASGIVTMARKDHGLNLLTLALTADLADLQQNMHALLSAELNKDNSCGDRIEIQDATLAPIEPAALAVVHLHYERWACVKLFGKEQTKKLISGNAVIQMKLTPAVGPNHTELQLIPELEPIEADGSLGEVLHAGNFDEILRDQIQSTILSAMQKGLDLDTILPHIIQGDVTVQDVRFRDAGSGSLSLTLNGQAAVTNEQLQALAKQAKARLPLR
jgi:hypothetical protein